MTAAHCCDVVALDGTTVVAGEHTLYDDSEGNEQRMDVAEIVSHEAYDSVTIDNDICLLKLAQALQFNEYVML